MAGISALYRGLGANSSWYRCPDGKIIEPLDFISLLFPNKGRGHIGENVCFVPRPFKFSALSKLLPPTSEYFVLDELVDSIVCLLLLCILTTVGMVVVKKVWESLDSRFASIHPPHKKWYVVANLSKAFFLANLSFSTRYWFGGYKMFLDDFQMIELKRCALVYIATDVAALYMVPKLPRSTVMHHISTATLALIGSAMNLQLKGWGGLLGVCKMGFVYGLFSTGAFLVNAYLALRVVYPKAKWLPALVKFNLWIYIAFCTMNWTVHAIWVIGIIFQLQLSIFTLLYALAISTMINDDIVLIGWLMKRTSPMASEKDKPKQQ